MCWSCCLQVAAVGGAEALPQHPLPHIPHPPPQLPSLRQLAAAADARQAAPSGDVQARRAAAGDGVVFFGETAAAGGDLGRFPGCEVMPLLQRFLGVSCTRTPA